MYCDVASGNRLWKVPWKIPAEERWAQNQTRHDLAHDDRLAQPLAHIASHPGDRDDHDQLNEKDQNEGFAFHRGHLSRACRCKVRSRSLHCITIRYRSQARRLGSAWCEKKTW